jgi:hypothetical protein
LEAATAVVAGQRLDGAGLILHVRGAVAVELEKQRRRNLVRRLRVAVRCVHLNIVQQLDPRHRNAELDGRDHRRDRALDR